MSWSREMSYTFSGKPRFFDFFERELIVKCSPLITLVLLVKHDLSLKVQWFADTLLFRAPVTIAVGCRLVLSIREAATSPAHSYASSNTMVLSTVVFEGDAQCRGEDTTLYDWFLWHITNTEGHQLAMETSCQLSPTIIAQDRLRDNKAVMLIST